MRVRVTYVATSATTTSSHELDLFIAFIYYNRDFC